MFWQNIEYLKDEFNTITLKHINIIGRQKYED